MISVLLPIICLVAFQLMSIKDDSIHYLLSYWCSAHHVRRLSTHCAKT